MRTIGDGLTEVESRLRDAKWDYRKGEAADVVNTLGVYVLELDGVIVHIGKTKCVEETARTHRALVGKSVPPWSPIKGIRFDRVVFFPSHPDRIDADLETLRHSLQESKAA